jgi:hypothetical protein
MHWLLFPILLLLLLCGRFRACISILQRLLLLLLRILIVLRSLQLLLLLLLHAIS